ncbi:MAG: hypothetical protein NTY20_00140 [Candidatus Aenigmarchaeota archaeon]|nr:hypothetical protein [Candidatus Aenigmarchaeota archaeon]
MADFSNMLAFAPELLKGMPLIFQTIQIVAYIFFILFFGSIIIRGFRGYLPWYMKLIGRVGFGFITLVCAVALSTLIPIESTGIYKVIFTLIQLNLWIGGIISTVILTVSLFLISNKIYNIRGMEKAMERLKARLEKAKDVAKDMSGKTLIQKLLQPITIIGIVLFGGFLVFSLINFKGFPNPSDNVLSAIGLNQSDIDKLTGYIQAVSPNQTENMPEGCVSPLELAQNFQQAILQNSLPVYIDSGMRTLIESNSKDSVELMYRVEYKQRVYALAITTKQSICSAIGTLFCGCINLGSMV